MSKARKKAEPKKRTKAGTSKEAAAARVRAFVEAYISNGGNATSAAISAGFAPRSAYQRGYELVKDSEVQALLKQRREQIASKLSLTTDSVIRRLAEIVEADITQLLDARGGILPVKEWPAEVRRAVASIKWGKFGPEIRFHNVPAALGDAMKHLGMFKEDNKQKADALAALLGEIGGNRDAFKPGSASE